MATCQLELLHVGVTVMEKRKKKKKKKKKPEKAGREVGRSAAHGGSPPAPHPPHPPHAAHGGSPPGSDAQAACWPKVAAVHTQSVCAVSQAVSADGDRPSVRLPALVRRSSQLCHVPRRVDSSITRSHLDANRASFFFSLSLSFSSEQRRNRWRRHHPCLLLTTDLL